MNDAPMRFTLQQYRDVQVVVLGASGFIGRWVARALCAQGADLHLVVRSSAAASRVFDEYEIRGEVIEADLTKPGAVDAILERSGPALVFNVAGYGVDRSERDPDAMRLMNTDLVAAIARAVAPRPVGSWDGPVLVHVGSAAEYGPFSGRVDEAREAVPATEYGITKLAGTEHLRQICMATGLVAVTARLFTVYGPGEHDGRLLSTLLTAAAKGSAVALSAGYQRRDFTYVEDAAEGLLRLGVARPVPGEAVNLATGQLTSVREFAEEAAHVLGIQKSALDFGAAPVRSDEMFHDGVAIERLRALTGWRPATGIAEGVQRAAGFSRARRYAHE